MDLIQTRQIPKQMVQKLREAGRLFVGNIPLAELMRHLETSHPTYQRGIANMRRCDLKVWHAQNIGTKKRPVETVARHEGTRQRRVGDGDRLRDVMHQW